MDLSDREPRRPWQISAPEIAQESEPVPPELPSMDDIRSVSTDLDEIDEILARLEDNSPDPDDQDPLLADR